jgi:predicted F0F1-ATPase subunit
VTDPKPDLLRRRDALEQTRRDVGRLRRREPERRFWQYVSVLGSVGWPIALLAVAGGALGRSLDQHWGTGVRLTFSLLALGAFVGCWVAWHAVKGRRP